MADEPAVTRTPEARRTQILGAAAEHIAANGVGETRIADVARRADVSSALVIYYFGTRDRLLVDALRFSEQSFYDAAEKMLAEVTSVHERLALLIRSTCVPEAAGEVPGAWGLWFDVWAQAYRHPEVAKDRVELDARWRAMIAEVVRGGQDDGDVGGDVDVERFCLTFSALLDGLSIQVALEDPQIDPDVAYRIAMDFAEGELGLAPGGRPSHGDAAQAEPPRS